MKRKKSSFTLVELLAVLGIIAILVAILIPAVTMVKNAAKETQQRAQLTTIEMGLTAFKNDYGDYPPSQGASVDDTDDYSGAQMLTEALVGWDLLGFHPKSKWDSSGSEYNPPSEDNLKERRGPYLELATANAFRLGQVSTDKPGLFDFATTPLEEETYVLCDVFTIRRITLPSGNIVKAGTPILYYKANTSSKTMDSNSISQFEKLIYNAYDNFAHIKLGSVTVDGKHGKPHPLGDNVKNLYDLDEKGGIRDSKIIGVPWPYRPDSYILISAGVDGLYGTSDDIRNF